MSVLFSFNKSGVMIAPPRMTFATQGAPANVRDAYFKSINASLSGCEPFKFTLGLGDNIAGRPIMTAMSIIATWRSSRARGEAQAPSPSPRPAMTAVAPREINRDTATWGTATWGGD
jgi:hypothetical protein